MNGTLIPTQFLDADDDYIEQLRGYLYPRIHNFLVEYTPAYGVGTINDAHYAGTIPAEEEVIEQELDEVGVVRNPVACFKKHKDGRESEGSWVLLPEYDPGDYVTGPNRQLHLTLFPRRDGKTGREIYAHDEYDWRDCPFKHLRAVNWKLKTGKENARRLIEQETFLDCGDLN